MKPVNTDIDIILGGCIRAQPAAQKELLRRYAASLMAVCKRYARCQADAEDILQEGFIQIFSKIRQYDAQKGSLYAWMRKVVIHCALAQYRGKRFQMEQELGTLGDDLELAPEILQQLDYEFLLNLVNELPENARDVFNLAVFDEFSHDEIAALLKIPAGTSRSLLSRARSALQSKIQKLHAHELARI